MPRWTKLRRENRDETIRVSRTIARQVMETKEAILSADAASDSRFEMSQSIADFRIRSMMCAPLLDRDGKAIGILQIDTLDQRQRFQDEDLELLVSTASQASIAIVNAHCMRRRSQRRTLERDLELAREVQRAFLPTQAPGSGGITISTTTTGQPHHIGGDYYDYVRLPDGRLAVIVADVVGHGVAAAMLMAKLSAEARFSLAGDPQPAQALTALNERHLQSEPEPVHHLRDGRAGSRLHHRHRGQRGAHGPAAALRRRSAANRAATRRVRRWAFSRRWTISR